MNETQLVRIIQQTVQPMLDQALAEQDDKLNTGLAKMFTYMERRFDKLDQKKADKTDVERILAILDKDLKRREIEYQERMAILSELQRHDRWIHQLAKSTNTRLATQG